MLRVTAAWLAGITHMPWWRFFLWNAAGGIVWATCFGAARLLLRQGGRRRAQPLRRFGAAIIVALGALFFVGVHFWNKRLESSDVGGLEVDQTSSFVFVRRITSSVNSDVDECPARSAVLIPCATASSDASRIARPAVWPSSVCESSAAAARIIASGFATFLPSSDGRRAVCRLRHQRGRLELVASNATSIDSEPAIDPKSGSTRSERMSPSRFSAGITSGSPVEATSSANVASISCGSYGTVGCRSAAASISSFSIPSYVGETVYFGPPNTLAPVRSASRNANSATARQTLRSIRSVRNATSESPSPSRHSFGAVGVADRHAHDRDRRVHAAERHDAGNATTGAHDHLATDLLAQDAVRRADIVARLRRDRRGLQSEPVPADRLRGLVNDAVAGRAAARQREVEPRQRHLDADHVRGEHSQRLLEELLAGLVALEDDDRLELHRRRRLAAAPRGNARLMPQRIGWRREGSKRHFRYIDAEGRRITDKEKLERIRALVIPPAWKDVWISPSAAHEAAGDRGRRGGAEAVPLPPGLPRAAGAGQVRQADPLRREAARAA